MAKRRRILTGCLGGAAALTWILGLACGSPDPEPHIEKLKSIRADVREKAAAQLLQMGDAVVPRLIEESESDYTRVRFEVARLLNRLRDPRATDAMIRLLDDRSFNVAAYAARGLGEIGSAAALEPLLRFPESPAKVFREQVVFAIGRTYDDTLHAALRDSVHHVVERALSDPVPEVRIAALQSARQLGYPDMVGRLLRMAHDPSAEVRHVAVQALGQVATGSAARADGPVTGAPREQIVEALLRALEEPYQSIRSKAVRALEQMGPPRQAAPALRKLLEEGTEEDRREARRVLESFEGDTGQD